MHIVEAAAEDDSNMPKEFGITGRVRQDMDRLRAEMTDMVQQTEERLSSQIESIHTMLENMTAKKSAKKLFKGKKQ